MIHANDIKTEVVLWETKRNCVYTSFSFHPWHYERAALTRLETMFLTTETRGCRNTIACVSVSICGTMC